jgi:hypothetical protein
MATSARENRGSLTAALRHWENRRELAAQHDESPGPRKLTIALARQAGTKGAAIGQEVGRRLAWPVYDHQLLERISQEMGLRVNLLESLDERHVNWLEEFVASFLGTAPVCESGFVYHLARTIAALATHGGCVIVGRGAALILPKKTTLRVRLVAPLRERVAVVAKRWSLTDKEALAKTKQLDREQREFIRGHFHREPADSSSYDLVLNVADMTAADCAELIVDAARLRMAREDAQTTRS